MKPAAKTETISLQRRHLMLAGAAAVLLPAGGWVWSRFTAKPLHAAAALQTLVASGRVTTADGRPLAGATITAGYACGAQAADRCSTVSDADGRFLFTTRAPQRVAGHLEPLHAEVQHPAHAARQARIHLEAGSKADGTILAHTVREDSSTLRASFGLTVA